MSWVKSTAKAERTVHAKVLRQDFAGELEKQGGGPCVWSRVSEGERGRN